MQQPEDMMLAEMLAKNGPILDQDDFMDPEILELAELLPLDYEKARREKAKEMGIRVTILDDLVKAARSIPETCGESNIFFSEPEPWTTSVDGKFLLDDLKEMAERFLVLPPGASSLMALWVLHTYCFAAFSLSPYLTFVSPTKQCGKSTAIKLLLGLVNKPLPASNGTAAVIFRAIDKWQPTLLLDEADSFVTNDEGIRGILNAGHTKRLAYVLRCVGDEYEPKHFTVWTPKALAAIGNLQPTVMDRSIVVEMQRKKPSQKVERLEDEFLDSQELEVLCRKCVRWSTDNTGSVRHNRPRIRDGLNDRVADNWMTLMKVAEVAEWRRHADYALNKLIPQLDDADDLSVMLLNDIRALFVKRNSPSLSSEDIVNHLNDLDERPWPGLNREKGLTKIRLAKMLKPFKVRPGTVRFGDRTPKGYRRDSFENAWEQYLLPFISEETATTPQRDNRGASSLFESATSPSDVSDGIPLVPLPDKDCGVVADCQGAQGRRKATI